MASYSHIVSYSLKPSSDPELLKSKTYTASGRVGFIDETAAGSSTTEIVVALDVSAVKSFFLVSDVACTVETNSSGAPDDTITLVAGVPYLWNTDSYDTFKLATDVTSIFVTVSGSGDATLTLEAIYDATP